MNDEQKRLEYIIVKWFICIGAFSLLAIFLIIFNSLIKGDGAAAIFLRICWLFSVVVGILYFLIKGYKIFNSEIKPIERDKAFFDFLDIQTDSSNGKQLIFKLTQKDLFICIEKLATVIAILSIVFLMYNLKFNNCLFYLANFIATIFLPALSIFFFFYVLLKILISIFIHIMGIKQFSYDNEESPSNSKQETPKPKIKDWLTIIVTILITFSLIISTFQIALLLTP